MHTKMLLILANSLKAGGRCIAGREILWLPDGRWHFGGWIRPVSAHGTGELGAEEILRADGTPVGVLDFATIHLQEHCGDNAQPENRLIAGPRAWGKPDRIVKPAPLAALEEHPKDLWLDPGNASDRVGPDFLRERRPASSLAVIRPEALELAWWVETGSFKKREQRKFRARFRYNGIAYDLSLTDPLASERICQPAAVLGQEARKLPVAAKDVLLCVSLTPLFGGFHYKVAATVLGIPDA